MSLLSGLTGPVENDDQTSGFRGCSGGRKPTQFPWPGFVLIAHSMEPIICMDC